jgi:hypothetical protein
VLDRGGGRRRKDDDIIVVRVVIKTREPRLVGRARVGERHEAEKDGDKDPGRRGTPRHRQITYADPVAMATTTAADEVMEATMRVVDLSFPIRPHFRWKIVRVIASVSSPSGRCKPRQIAAPDATLAQPTPARPPLGPVAGDPKHAAWIARSRTAASFCPHQCTPCPPRREMPGRVASQEPDCAQHTPPHQPRDDRHAAGHPTLTAWAWRRVFLRAAGQRGSQRMRNPDRTTRA